MSDGNQPKIYVLKHEHGYYKIGKSNDPEQRLLAVQTCCPYEVELETTIEVVGSWKKLEQAIHDSYEKYHVRGEWYDLPPITVLTLTELDKVNSDFTERVRDWTPSRHNRFDQRQREDWLMNDHYKVEP